MRKIKFRAWNKETHKMVFQCDMNDSLENKEYYFTLNEDSVDLLRYDEDYSAYVNCNADIMQYTGIKDAEGKEIYEGDIVKASECIPGEDFIGKVIYDEWGGCYFMIREGEGNYCKITIDLEYYSHYVIGNIYENPELLG